MNFHAEAGETNPYTFADLYKPSPPTLTNTTGLMSDFPEDFLEMEVNFSTPQEVAAHI